MMEAKILKSFTNPFIVSYIDSFIIGDKINIVMEYCEKGDLSNLMKQYKKRNRRLDESKIWYYFTMICLGLSCMHRKNILHRDLKSLNVFITNKNQIRIGDLGVAKILENTNFAKTFIGTPYYLSPEMCEDKPYNQKSDIWALGIILYELCTFRHPFNATNQVALIRKIIENEPEPIRKYSSDLQEMINRCLKKDQKKRPTIDEILKDPGTLVTSAGAERQRERSNQVRSEGGNYRGKSA